MQTMACQARRAVKRMKNHTATPSSRTMDTDKINVGVSSLSWIEWSAVAAAVARAAGRGARAAASRRRLVGVSPAAGGAVLPQGAGVALAAQALPVGGGAA